MKYVGVDACKCGWMAAIMDKTGVRCEVFPEFAGIWDAHSDIQRLFVDIPVGLAAEGDRGADMEARRFLPPGFKSSIFNTPVRKALYARTNAEAKSINQELTGKSLSEQSLGISKKIREVDRWLQAHQKEQGKVFESHPEICFIHCAGGPLSYGKKDFLGTLERMKIVRKFVKSAEDLLVSVRERYTRTNVAADDILDAMVLAVVAKECDGRPSFFPAGVEEPPQDETGLPMAVWYHDFSNPR
ncbi:DUF429 domain-containing protein [Pseudodesulfovibrio piezophilus]|uniref:NUDIX hydrolase n=1 Tax=Pseudodesulfovibrio piezophilus (strain DSM 21447 / JCM 15486 / C1TLV30) TaxID=1322246 RepID=M1WMG4_PSEP2|nr:DUF429 domain-containing protein [Pseudodesulfovibrio piezophilus]CCH49560.1 NUDIX hydrolase [Pseudodesulfovibrio piezophilus C1TLV30]